MTNLTRPPGVTKLAVTPRRGRGAGQGQSVQRLIEADNGPSDLNDNLLEDKNADRGYNAFWVDPGNFLASVNGEYRTSWIVEPANGQMPLSDAGRQLRRSRRAPNATRRCTRAPRRCRSPERCLIGFSGAGGPGMLNPMYNNNYQIVQTPDAVLILVEMVHDARIIPIAKDKAAAQATHARRPQPWLGDRVGWWEGDTLVVETINVHRRAGERRARSILSDKGKVTERFSARRPTSSTTSSPSRTRRTTRSRGAPR